MHTTTFATRSFLLLVAASGCAMGGVGDADPWMAAEGSPDLDPAGLGAPGPYDPEPATREPCRDGRCWLGAPAIAACGATTVHEDFSTGRYDAHRFAVPLRAGVVVDVALEVTGGAFRPALVVSGTDGETLYDGEVGTDTGVLALDRVEPGRTGGRASVRIAPAADGVVDVWVTSWEVLDGGVTMPSDARYTLDVETQCPAIDPVAEAVCPLDPGAITHFGSGWFTTADSPYRRDTRASHSGYDLHAPLGVDVYATQSGTIVAASTENVGDCGRSINLATDAGITFRYCHLDRVLVTSGRVTAGQVIAVNGQTGNAHSPHVHFVYLDAPNVTGSGTAEQKSERVNAYVDELCR